jgi:hypothetical protein
MDSLLANEDELIDCAVFVCASVLSRGRATTVHGRSRETRGTEMTAPPRGKTLASTVTGALPGS